MSPRRLVLFAAAAALLASGGCASRRAAAAAEAAPGRLTSSGGGGAEAGAAPGSFGGAAGGLGAAGDRAALVREFSETVGERVFFAFDSHLLTDEARATLDAQANWLRPRPDVRVLVAGNADERGTREYNLALGSRRAQAARDYLVSRGVAAGRIDTVSYGKERPIDPRPSEEGWARNRNAHSVLIDLVGGD